MRIALLVAACMALITLGDLGSGTALAQEPSSHVSPPEAMEFFRTAREHYRDGHYPEAAADLERALVLDPISPTLRYNLGRVYELLGELPRALEHYRRYLELLPEDATEERARTDSTVQRLEGAIAAGSLHVEATAPSTEPLRELRGSVVIRELGVADEAFWITIGSGAAVLVAAAITGALAFERASARDGLVLTEPGQYDAHRAAYASIAAEADTLALVTDVLLGVGGAALVAGVLLFALRESQTEQPAEAGVAPFVAASEVGAVIGMRGPL